MALHLLNGNASVLFSLWCVLLCLCGSKVLLDANPSGDALGLNQRRLVAGLVAHAQRQFDADNPVVKVPKLSLRSLKMMNLS